MKQSKYYPGDESGALARDGDGYILMPSRPTVKRPERRISTLRKMAPLSATIACAIFFVALLNSLALPTPIPQLTCALALCVMCGPAVAVLVCVVFGEMVSDRQFNREMRLSGWAFYEQQQWQFEVEFARLSVAARE